MFGMLAHLSFDFYVIRLPGLQCLSGRPPRLHIDYATLLPVFNNVCLNAVPFSVRGGRQLGTLASVSVVCPASVAFGGRLGAGWLLAMTALSLV